MTGVLKTETFFIGQLLQKWTRLTKRLEVEPFFKGGTGQFKNAEGYMDLSGHPDPKEPTSRFVVEKGLGEISNIGS